MGKVIVYKFYKYNVLNDEVVTSTRMATQEAIDSICASKIEGTQVEIDESLTVSTDGGLPGMTAKNFIPPE
jgi:hypothetical protein